MGKTGRHSWTEVRERIRARILDGSYHAGQKLPRDEDLAAELGCARSTVQRAMRDLADAGMIERRRKGGSRVRLDPVTRATFEIPIIRQEVEQSGKRYDYRLIDRALAVPPADDLAKFGLARPREMLRIRALHLADGKPHVFEDRWVCPQTVPEILTLDLTRENANEWLVRNKPYSRCDLRFLAIGAGAREARILACPPGAALFVIERTTWIGPAPITSVRAVAAPGYQLTTRA